MTDVRSAVSEALGLDVRPQIPDPRLVDLLVREFSHGVFQGFDPTRQCGSQRENFSSLGFGIIYLALAQVLEAEQILVIGSGKGFSVACLALGVASRPSARVTLVDPSYAEWMVDGTTPDHAEGFWVSSEQAAGHFSRHLGLTNVEFVRATSDDAFARLRAESRQFDVILIDGEHSFSQCSKDLEQAVACLTTKGGILVHDARCAAWPGVAAALEHFRLARPEFQHLVLPMYPGLALLTRRQQLLTIRPSSAEENEEINIWRHAGNVTPRPLAGGDDPRVGVQGNDPRVGLFSIMEDGDLVGGVGIREKVFQYNAPDDFIPDAGGTLRGFLRYGTVIREDKRGRGRFQLADFEIMRWFGENGFYFLTNNPVKLRRQPFVVERVGATPHHTAYRKRPAASLPNGSFAEGITERYASALRCNRDLDQRVALLKERLASVESSICWRATQPLRRLLDRLRGA